MLLIISLLLHLFPIEKEPFDAHCPTIVETVEGNLLSIWKGGVGEGLSSVDMKESSLWASWYQEDQWSDPQVLMEFSSLVWNPVLYQYPEGALYLFYREGDDPRHTVGYMTKSLDGGRSFEQPTPLPNGFFGPTKGRPVLDSQGFLVIGSSIEVEGATALMIDLFDPRENTWSKMTSLSLPNEPFGAIEPVLFYTKEGNLKLFCRDRGPKVGRKGYVWEAISYDEGRSWSSLKPTCLPNCDAPVEVVDLGKERHLLFYHPSHTARDSLRVALSKDDGETFVTLFDVNGEFPSAIKSKEGRIHLVNAFYPEGMDQRRIQHISFDLGVSEMHTIVVGSTNKIKLAAVEEVLCNYPEFACMDVVGKKVDTSVSCQPTTLEETIEGAKVRAKQVKAEGALGMGIESGLMPVPGSDGEYFGICVCVIDDGIEEHIGLSCAHRLPKAVTDAILEDQLDLNQALSQCGLTENTSLGTHEGAIGLFTNGRITRQDYTKQAIICALTSLENKSYFDTLLVAN